MYQSRLDPDTKIWSGVKVRSLFNPNISIGQAVLWTMRRNPDHITQVRSGFLFFVSLLSVMRLIQHHMHIQSQISHDNGVEVTNGEMCLRIARAAQNMLQCGYQEDDVFAIIARNSENLAPIVFAAMAIGCPVSTLDPSFSTREVTHMFRITQPKVVFCDSDKIETVRESLAALELDATIFTFDEETEFSRHVNDLLVETGEEDSFV